MLLPDPYDADWETCLAGYRFARCVTMNRLYRVLQTIARLEAQIDAIDERGGGPTPEEDREITDRLRLQNVLQNIERQNLVGMRFYLDIARVVHKRADRSTYELVYRNAQEQGIPPYLTRQMIDETISRDN